MSVNINYYATYVELQDIPSYSTNITVEGQLLKLSFLWNERIGKRVLSIKNSSDVVYLQNTILHPNEPLELNSNAVLDDLPYSVTLVKTGDVNKVGNIFNWSKDFILCFSRTVDLDVKKLNVVYGVTTPSTPILPPPTPAFGDWILNQGFTILGDDIRYAGYKTNGVNTYDSFADFDLVTALVRSFHDSDLQQYSAFTTAVEQLTGTVDWVLDSANNQIAYTQPSDPLSPDLQYLWPSYDKNFATPSEAFDYWTTKTDTRTDITVTSFTYTNNGATARFSYTYYSVPKRPNSQLLNATQSFNRIVNPNYDPNYEPEEKYLPLEVVAQKVISNANSGDDEILQMLSQDYINLVANSIFNSDESKRFVKLEDLIPQLEANKVLR